MKVNTMLFRQNGHPWKGEKCKITMVEKKVEEYGGEANDNWENCGEVDGEIDNEDEDEKEGDEEGEDEETDDDNEYGLPPATAYMAVVADPGDHK